MTARLRSRSAAVAILTLMGIAAASAHDLDLKRLPLGDGKISREPKAGWIWACRIDPNAGGAFRAGLWIDAANGTFDLTAKIAVGGAVSGRTNCGSYAKRTGGSSRPRTCPTIRHEIFPIARTEPAYQYDRNPNRIAPQSMRLELPAIPALATPACAPGAVGILLTGVVLFNALDAPGRDAVAHETQDRCQGHPQISGVYHYHNLTSCIDDKPGPSGHSPLVGYALDGFGIFGNYHAGKRLMSADLDPCHGHTHAIEWDGRTVGCMRGGYGAVGRARDQRSAPDRASRRRRTSGSRGGGAKARHHRAEAARCARAPSSRPRGGGATARHRRNRVARCSGSTLRQVRGICMLPLGDFGKESIGPSDAV